MDHELITQKLEGKTGSPCGKEIIRLAVVGIIIGFQISIIIDWQTIHNPATLLLIALLGQLLIIFLCWCWHISSEITPTSKKRTSGWNAPETNIDHERWINPKPLLPLSNTAEEKRQRAADSNTRVITLPIVINHIGWSYLKHGFTHCGTTVTGVIPGGWAELNGLRRGDQIIAINSVNVDTLPSEKFQELLCSENIQLVVR